MAAYRRLSSTRFQWLLQDHRANQGYEIVEEFEQKRIAYEISIKSLLYRILTILYRNNVLIFSTMDSLYQQNEELNRLGTVIEYIELHYNEDINVEMACGLLNLNYFYFCRMFKKVIGRTFVQYLNYVRVSVAEKLLLTTNMPITDIIMETGFSSLSYFNRIFKSHKGCSPSTFRKSKTANDTFQKPTLLSDELAVIIFL